ncbi:uncharacterized protein CTHT_0051460 [Thermochaetoides thermophila DSM 1495]|uniref:BRCT domain-containing protein n=1 Tax=Chaetomium thermophilum (strain DSM 1495 / CBS 144.50 / IMI 039719) TaxID=759272 RepID=G0SDE1_CHATD|nr:hypothetical protein CTHT_0051460 [Thermochaetoides thermophila DSM 1495]EGS18542.1 hypothetical protein CTHT_0051460 [Thermochaetoides thermophila DSM 1495]
MPAPPKSNHPLAEPRLCHVFDPWNSASTGHQLAEGQRSQGWRDIRNFQLNKQFGADVGKLSNNQLGKLVSSLKHDAPARPGRTVADMLRNPGTMLVGPSTSKKPSTSSSVPELVPTTLRPGPISLTKPATNDQKKPLTAEDHRFAQARKANEEDLQAEKTQRARGREAGRLIFEGVVVYINGSTYPLVSDHRLRQLLARHGARMSLHLGRRSVTHVIIGRPAALGPSATGSVAAGGGLAAGKLEKETRRVGGSGVKYVGVEWVLESIKAGKRLPESRFAILKIAPRRQQSILGAFSKHEDGNSPQLPASFRTR